MWQSHICQGGVHKSIIAFLLESFLSDVRFALRWLRRSPGFTLVAIASLAIGIGFNTALFAIVDAVLFKPLPVAAPDRLVDIYTTARATRFGTTSYADYLDLTAENDVFEGAAGYSPMFAALNLENRSRLAIGEIVTGNYFQVLGVGAAMGRTILPEDDRAGSPRVAMVSHRYWLRELAAAPDAVGRMLRIRGNPYVIVGVAPATFTGMVPVLAPEIWIPVSASLEVEPVGMHDTVPGPGTTRLDRRGDRWMFMRARLKPGKTRAEAEANLNVLMARLEQANPQTNKERRTVVRATSDVHFHPAVDSTILPIAGGLMIVVGLVLLTACANVASMLLARASGRQKEIGIRLAIGASRGRLVRQLVTEALVMSFVGAAVGTLLAWWVTSIATSISLPLPFPLTFNLRIDARVLLFTTGAALFAALFAGLAPAVQASRPAVIADLRGEQPLSRAAGHRWTLRDMLVAGQLAVTGALLVIAALLTRTLIAAQRTQVGFPVDKLAVISTDTAMAGYSGDRSRQFYTDAMAQLKTIPGVESVALATRVPFSINYNRWDVWIPDHHRPGERGDFVDMTAVSPDYFDTIGVPIVAGRAFTEHDRPATQWVAVANETFARRYWPNESAVGKTFRSRVSDGPVFQIVGVSADHKVLTLGEPPTAFLHVSLNQRPNTYASILARTRGDSTTLLREMRRVLLAMEPNLVFVENQTMNAEVSATLFPVRAGAWLVSGVGLTAMVLAAIGLYGVIAYSVALRTREIGVRIALGARPAMVVGLVMQHGLFLAAAGLAVGCVMAAVAAGLIANALYGVRPSDPISWLAAIVVVLGVAALANFIPAWRAARVDPSTALRTE
jgi:macrolide transport system ATP-binding/permease protein